MKRKINAGALVRAFRAAWHASKSNRSEAIAVQIAAVLEALAAELVRAADPGAQYTIRITIEELE